VQVSGEWKLEEIFVAHDGFQLFVPPVPLGAIARPQIPPGMNVGGDFRPNAVPAKAEQKPGDQHWWKAARGLAPLLGKFKVPGVIAVTIGAVFTWLRRAVAPPSTSK